MNWLKSYLLLPAEITAFERQYLSRLNRIALVFFVCHVPAFMGIALIAGTSVLQAGVLTLLALVGPALAYKVLHNPRHLSVVFGFTAMCMGGLLVHVGKGAMQIEMHFYFFVLIALLAVFANPIAIVAAAVTVALHHLIIFLVLPRSVFNYDASIWAVVVHSAFVVLESVAACFVARSFFDNVIGLEKIVKRRTDELSERNADMRLILDNVGQGFLTINLDGSLAPERSAVIDTWLGPLVPGTRFWDYIVPSDPSMSAWFQVGWEAVLEDTLPIEMAIGQMPKRWTGNDKTFSFEYRPVLAGDKLVKILLVMSDVTVQMERERFEAEQRDLLCVFEQVAKDKKGFLAFFAEANEIVEGIVNGDEALVDLRRHVHTLKGNCGLFGLSRLASFCHDLETSMTEHKSILTSADRERLRVMWGGFVSNLHMLLGTDQANRVEIEHGEYLAVLKALQGNVAREDIAWRVKAWEFESTEKILNRVAEQARAIAERMGRLAPEVVIESNGLRLFPERWAEFWSAFTHVIRNALDHGIEGAEGRAAAGKSPRGVIRLGTWLTADDFVIEISDDGRGIAWEALRGRAVAAGLPHEARADLVEALFRDGVTTKTEISEFSGRGIGMGAMRAVCEKMGGSIHVVSTEGTGTSLRFTWSGMMHHVRPLVLGPITVSDDGPTLLVAGGNMQ